MRPFAAGLILVEIKMQNGGGGMGLGIRWTIGDVSPQGFEALHLSIQGAWKLFNTAADYAVYCNRIPPALAQELTGDLPATVDWRDATEKIPEFLRDHLDSSMAEGVAWKFAPLRAFPEQFELALDNDCILWAVPEAMKQWLSATPEKYRCLLAEDVLPAFGQFAHLCGPEPRNSGIRGFPPGWDFKAALGTILRRNPVLMRSELDEQGLLTAAFSLECQPGVVSLREVSICSPIPPHLPDLGSCGAHFCGLNAKRLAWNVQGRPMSELIHDHWCKLRPSVAQKVSASSPPPLTAHKTGSSSKAGEFCACLNRGQQ